MDKQIIYIIIGLALVYYLFFTNNGFFKQKKPDYYKQPFLYKSTEKEWKMIHGFIKNELKNYAYYSFDGSFMVNPKNFYLPKNLEELIRAVKKHNYSGSTINVSGGHHTFMDISITDDTIIRTFYLKKILNLNKNKKQITVESGILLDEINKYLWEHGLALHTQPAIPWQCIAGAISTATHGSNYVKGSFSSMVVDITMVHATKNGVTVKTYTKKDPEFKALTTGVGCLGAIYSVTLQCVDAYLVEHTEVYMPWSKFLKNFNILSKEYKYLQAYIEPYDDNLKTKVYLRRHISLDEAKRRKIDLNKLPLKDGKTKIDRGYKIFNKGAENTMGPYTEEEVAIPFKTMINAINDMVEIYRDYKKNKNFTTKFPILVRFVGEDDNLISTHARPGTTVWLDYYSHKKDKDGKWITGMMEVVEDMLIDKYNGRPHYGKRNKLNKRKMMKLYGKNYTEFNNIKTRLDPNGIFSNNYIKRLFG